MKGMLAVEKLERGQLKRGLPEFRPGDTIRVSVRVKEGERERAQVFEGVCIRRTGHGVGETITVRKISYGVGVERTFHLHSPNIARIEVRRQGKVRRARLYYLRDRVGKNARVRKERRPKVTVPEIGAAPRLSAEEATAAAEAARLQNAAAVAPEAPPAAAPPENEEPPAQT